MIFTFPANAVATVPAAAAVAHAFWAYIRVSRLFRRLSSATMAGLNAFVSEHANGAQVIRYLVVPNLRTHLYTLIFFRTLKAQDFVIDECMRETDQHQKHFFMEMVSDCWLFVRLQVIIGR